MIAIPSIELGGGRPIRQLAGSDADSTRGTDAVDLARSWAYHGFHFLHIHDVLAASGSGSSLPSIRSILFDSELSVQVAGGLTTGTLVEELFEAGAVRVVVDARAIDDPAWIADLAARHPAEILVACDVRKRRVSTRGWIHTLPVDILDVVGELNAIPLAGLLLRVVPDATTRKSTDLLLLEEVVETSLVRVYASGGITTMQDLRALEHRGLAGVVLGRALLDGRLDPATVAGEFSE